MKTCSRCKEAKAVEAYGKHKSTKDGLRTYCTQCEALRRRERYLANPERAKRYSTTWAERNREKYLDMHRLTKARARAAEPEKHRESSRVWAAKNPDKIADHDTRRRVAVKQAATKWDAELDAFAGAEAHRLKRTRREIVGGEWHVDHSIPLRGGTVCGLHNAYNLAVIPGSANMSKKNLYWKDMPL